MCRLCAHYPKHPTLPGCAPSGSYPPVGNPRRPLAVKEGSHTFPGHEDELRVDLPGRAEPFTCAPAPLPPSAPAEFPKCAQTVQ
jgi:hypothetical protein